MGRKRLIRSSEFVYHITMRSNSREWFFIPLEEVWRIANEVIENNVRKYQVKVHAFVLMNNHYHLVVRTPLENLDKFMGQVNTLISKRINSCVGKTNHVFGGRYHWSLVTKDHYYRNVIRYVYQNPIRAELCKRVEDYPYSSLHQVIHQATPYEMETFLDCYDLNWLNMRYNQEQLESLRKGNKRNIFSPSKSRRTRREVEM